MVNSSLTDGMIQAGRALVRELDQKELSPNAAFWFYFSDIETWKLIIAEMKVGQIGPRDIYKKIQNIIKKTPDCSSLNLDDVTLAKPDSPIVSLLRLAINTGPEISGIRFKQNVINGNVIEDAYIYRLLPIAHNK
ncbi:MAG: hypothetical protein L3J63_01005 [Geopsychrobacter sp.]|nr:hypothetical protein [Geopsychrobacter sp.]